MRRDAESVLMRVVELLQSDLNGFITAINTEKNDDVVLDQVDNAAYAIQELAGVVQNYNPFVLVGIDDIQSVGKGPVTSDLLTMTAVVILPDQGQDLQIIKRLLRYNRCLKDTIERNWSDSKLGTRFEISSLVPVQFTLANTSNLYRAVGIQIKTGIG